MSVREIRFFQAECDYCGKTFKYNSMQFTGISWELVPREYGWSIERDDWYYSSWKALCPKCKMMEENNIKTACRKEG